MYWKRLQIPGQVTKQMVEADSLPSKQRFDLRRMRPVGLAILLLPET